MKRCVLSLVVATAPLLPFGLPAQPSGSTFEPFPEGAATAYRFDLARNFYPTDQAATRERRRLVEGLARLASSSPRFTRSATTLLRALVTGDSLTRDLGRQYAYLSLRSAIDTRDANARKQLSELAGAVEPLLTEIERAVGDMSDGRVRAYTRLEPRLRRYRYAIELARRDRGHRLDTAAERALAAVETEATGWGPALFQTTLAGTNWGTVRAPEGELDVRRQGNQIRNHANRMVREAGYRQGQAGQAARRDTYAFILTREALARNVIARERRWPDYPTQAYAAGVLEPKEVRALLVSLGARSEVNKRYEHSRIEEIRRDFDYDTVHAWDLTAPVPGQAAPRFTVQHATREVIASAAPLGAGYMRELRALLDPANGRLDLVSRENRVDRPGFSTGSVGYPSMFFQGRFEGYVEDLTILAHEAGHGVQNMLMDSTGVLPRYASGPNYFTESFATLSELLLLHHLYRSSPNASDRRYYLRRLLDDALEVYRTGYESLVELQLYDSVAAGRLLAADGIERLTQDVGSRFSIWFGPASERTNAWVQPIQFYTRPLYRVNYVIAKLLALQYMDMLQRNPASFEMRYGQMLRNGYDAPPEELLRRFLGISLADPKALVDGALRVLEQWIAEAAAS